MKILVIFTLCLISDGGDSKEVTGYSGGGVLIKCKYHTGYTQNDKYFCKGLELVCSKQIKTGVKNKWIHSGRFSLYDDTKSAEFRVIIRELTVQNTGTYQCGVDKDWRKDIYTRVQLKIKNGPFVSREVIAYAGGGVNITCRYYDEYQFKPKSVCKVGEHQQCFNQMRIKINGEWSHDGRFSMYDNRSAGFFSVFIRELILEDTGTYACAVAVSDEIEIYTVVKLSVKEDPSYEKFISKTVHVGGNLNISCEYPESFRSNPRFLCKMGLQDSLCFYKETVKESRKYVNIGKFSLYDDRAKRILSVSIINVTERDSGEYWCGAEAAWKSDDGYKVYFTQINLTVTEPHAPVSRLKQTQPSSSPPPPSSTPLLLTNNHNSSWPTPVPPPAGFPASTVITVSVILLLLLIGITFLTLTLRKRCKMQASTDSSGRSSFQDSGNNQGVPLNACEYEEIKDTSELSAMADGTSTIYSTVQLPIVPSDPCQPLYDNMLHTVPPDQDIYSTAQSPTGLSTEKSIYATVSFHSKTTSSNDAMPQIVLKKGAIDSALVSHGTSHK